MRAWQAGALFVIAGAIGLATGSRSLQIAGGALIAVLLIGFAYRRLMTSDVYSVRTVSDDIVPWGENFAQQITLTNTSRLRMPAVRIIDQSTLPEHPHGYVTSLGAKRSITWETDIPCETRGRYRLGPVESYMSDPLGLFPVRRSLGAASSILVLPRWVPLRQFALKLDGFMPGEARGRRRGESPPTVVSVREYANGDSVSSVHWPATARTGQLMTKLFDPQVQTTLWLALDLDGSVQKDAEELLVTATASVGTYALHQANLRVGLLASGAVPVRLAPERGKPHQYRVQEALAEVHPGSAETLADQLARMDRGLGPGQVIVLVTSRGPDVWDTWLARLNRRGVAARVIAVRDEAARWPVQALNLPTLLAEPARERALITQLEVGDRTRD